MSDAIANILLQLQAKDDGADDKLKRFNETLDELGRKDVTVKAGVDTGEAQTKLDKLRLSLDDFGHKSFTAKVQLDVDKSKLDKAIAAVQDLAPSGGASQVLAAAKPSFIPGPFLGIKPIPGLENTSKEIENADVKAKSFFERLRGGFTDSSNRGGALGKTIAFFSNGLSDASLKAEQFKSALEGASKASSGISFGIAGVLDTLGGQSGLIGGPLSAIAKAFESLGALGPAAIIPVIGLLAVLVAAVNSLIATLVALGASVAAAVGGIAALGAAFVAALGPAVLLAIGVFKELTQIITQVSATSNSSSTAAKTLATALLTQKSAQDQLAAAQKNVAIQATAAAQAQRDAILAVADAYLQVREAQLGIPEAKTALEAADLALKTFKAGLASSGLSIGQLEKNPTGVAISGLTGSQQGAGPNQNTTEAARIQFQQLQEARAQALLRVTGAQNTLNDATNNYAKAQATSNNFTTNGLKAFPAYVSALKAVQTAQIAVERAALGVSSAQGKGVGAVSGLSAAGQKLVPIFQQVYKALSVFQPAIDAVLTGIGKGAQGLVPLFKALAPSFTQLGQVMGGAIAQVAKALESPAFVTVFKSLIASSGQLIKIATPGFIALLKIFLDIAKDAMPGLLLLFKQLSGVFVKVAKHPADIAKAVHLAVASFQAWAPLIGRVVIILGQLAGLAAPIGNGLVKQVTALLTRFSAFLNTKKGRDEVSKWISDGVKDFTSLVSIIGDLIVIIAPVLSKLLAIGHAILDIIAHSKTFRTVISVLYDVVIKPVFQAIELIFNTIKLSVEGWIKIVGLVGKAVGLIGKVGGALNPFQKGGILSSHAEGGVTTRASVGIIGEAGPEAVLPLTSQVFAALGSAIGSRVPTGALAQMGPSGARVQHNEFNVTAPGGSHPDTNHMMAAIEQRLSAIGVA